MIETAVGDKHILLDKRAYQVKANFPTVLHKQKGSHNKITIENHRQAAGVSTIPIHIAKNNWIMCSIN